MRAPVLKPLRNAQRWLALWWLAVALVALVELLPAMLLPQVPAGGDKVEHLVAYGALAVSAVQLFERRVLWRVGLGLAALGMGLEIAQGTLTTTRSFDLTDELANCCGVLLGLAVAFTPLRDLLLRHARRA
ncbi:MAG: VanZ family protein [Lysobacter sp.]|nr:VanZ family protein [Lysobacter sp.]